MNIKNVIESLLREAVEFEFEFSNKLDLVEDLGLDSIELINMVLQLEDKLNIVFQDEELDLSIITKVDLLIELVESKLN